MNRIFGIVSVALAGLPVAAGWGAGADADPAASVKEAAGRLAAQPGYTWKTTVTPAPGAGRFGGGASTTSGQLEREGYTWVTSTGDGELEFASKKGKAAVLLDGNWMTLAEASQRESGGGRGRAPRFDPAAVNEFKLPEAWIAELLARATDFQRSGEAVTAKLPAELVNELLTPRGFGGRRGRGGPEEGGRRGAPPGGGGLNDPRGSVSMIIRDGVPAEVTVALAGSRRFRDTEFKLDRTTTLRFSGMGTTRVTPPPDAKAIVDALSEGKPSPVFVPEPGFKKLFNGRDLTGWAGSREHWTVEDGVLVGRSSVKAPAQGDLFLVARDGEKSLIAGDFELRLSYRVAAGDAKTARAGVRYRARELPDGLSGGYLAPFEPAASGGPGGGWKDLVVIAQGKNRDSAHFSPAKETEGAEPLSGVLALQAPAGDLTVQVRNIRWRPLDTAELRGASALRTLKDFGIELIYTVPREREGSWVAMCLDPKGRLIVSDQNGGLHRVTLPAPDGGTVRTERLDLEVGGAHGLLWAFGSLYVVVNERSPRGLYRVRDTDGDDRLDKVELLRELRGGGEHGFHSVVLSPDGQSLWLVAGNQTQLTRFDVSRAPYHWSEDDLLARLPTGFMDDSYAPQGWIARVDPEGKTWELFAMGLRNPYDIAFNRAGDLFTYDADMEWDLGVPWYRPTRVNHVISGAEFGFRNGNGKWPASAIDSFGAVVDVGPGSPTGIAFGYGAKFPAKYQEALFIADWSFGKLRAVHLRPEGASYTGEVEDFVSGQPFPITDFLVNPNDGAMYAAVGGRGAQSALYRITYRGAESTAPAAAGAPEGAERRDLRRKLESFHGKRDPAAVEAAWPYLADADRAVRFAARVALEWQDVAAWRAKALGEMEPRRAIAALVALARASGRDSTHRKSEDPPPDPALRSEILATLERISWDGLAAADRFDLLRAYWLTFTRLGRPDAAACAKLIARLDPLFSARSRELNASLAQLLIYLEAPSAAAKVVAALREAPTQEEQIEYAVALRGLKTGWTRPLREEYFRWFVRAQGYRGGNTFAGSLRRAKENAVALLGEEERAALKPVLEATVASRSPQEILAARPLVREWTLEELIPIAERGLKERRSFERGRKAYGEVACAACHRFAGEGGSVGPDLSAVSGRFGVRDLLEAMVVPSKTISDQYQAVVIRKKNGQIVTGRIANLSGANVNVVENMLDPGAMANVRRTDIVSIEPSTVSPMPDGLLNSLREEEVQDLVAYLLSRGDPQSSLYR